MHIKTNEHGELVWDSGYQFLRLHHDWEEIKKPVDFMTAIQAYDNGRTIYVLHGTNGEYKETFTPKINATDWGYAVQQQQGYAVDSGLILSGKWYIED